MGEGVLIAFRLLMLLDMTLRCGLNKEDDDMVDESMSSLFTCPYIFSSSLSLSSNAKLSAEIARGVWLMPSTLNGDGGGGEGGVERMMWRVRRERFEVGRVLFVSESGVSKTFARTTRVAAMVR